MKQYQEILELERKILRAIFAADKEGMRALMIQDGLGVDPGFGFASQASLIDGIHRLASASWAMQRPMVIPAGEGCFVAAYELEQSGIFDGVSVPPRVYASTLWARRAEGWRAVFHQETPVLKA